MFLLQANTTSIISAADLQLIAPELILTACACVALVMEVILPYRKSKLTAYFSLAGVGLAFASLVALWLHMGSTSFLTGFYGMIRVDGFALLFKAIFLLAAALAIGISTRFLDIEGEQHGEYYALVLFATVGMMFIASGYDLISLYISLELMALTFYVLVAFTKREKKSNEAAMKYFLLGAFSSGRAALWNVVDLRHRRLNQHRRDRAQLLPVCAANSVCSERSNRRYDPGRYSQTATADVAGNDRARRWSLL